jgi:glycosyltransferase involved in cell wall biosynthesis
MATICLVTHFFPPHIGGIERVALEQSKRLTKLGYQITILTSTPQKLDMPTSEGIEIFNYPVLGLGERIGLPYPIPLFRSHRVFRDIIRKCDLVHAHGHPYLSSLMACKVAQHCNKPFILTQHNTFVDFDSWLNIVELLNDWVVGTPVLKDSDRVITVSKKTREYVLKFGVDVSKTSVIYNGVDTDFFHPMDKEKSRVNTNLPSDKTLILTVRRLVYKNGLDTLIEAISLLAKDYPDLLFVVIGNGPDRNIIEKRARGLGIKDSVELTGFVPEAFLPQYYNAADYFVLPSSSGEGLPMVLLEAMACQLPVIATTTGGTTEIIKEMKNGVLVPPRNPKALAQAVSRLLPLKRKSRAIGEENRKTVEANFTWDENVRQLNDIYREFL